MKPTWILAGLLALGLVPAQAATDVSLFIGIAPPPPRFESVPPPRYGYVWSPGFWNWDGYHHVWVGGHWELARPGMQFIATEWVREGGGWRLRRGGWEPVVVDQDLMVAPPAPRYEPVPYPRPGYLWSPGHWEWRYNHHEWVPGFWIAERPGYVYLQPAWVQRSGRWYLEPGHWSPRAYERRAEHDRDHDGIPDRFDRHPHNPYRD